MESSISVKSSRKKELDVIGWREWISLPELGIQWIKAKVDTGARTSSLHAFDIKTFRRARRLWVGFRVHPIQRNSKELVECRAPVLGQRHVRSSSGSRQLRFVIETDVELGGDRWPMELTLASRDLMGFRMLLGRQAVRDRFVIDPGSSFLSNTL